MMTFAYKALTAGGELVDGQLAATDKASLVRRLHELGYQPIRAEPLRPAMALARAELRLPWARSGVSGRDLQLLTRELATLANARMPLDRSLRLMLELGAKGAVRSLLADLLERLERGSTLADAIAAHPKVFPGHYVSMVRAGEAGGGLHEVLASISDHLEKSGSMRETVRSALIYPLILLLMVAATLIVMLTLVLPKFQRMFESAGARLPLPAVIVMRVGEWFRAWGWWAIPAGMLAAALLLRWRIRRPKGRMAIDRSLLRLPLLGGVLARIETARFAMTMSSLLRNGVDVLAGLAIVRDTVTNQVMRAAIDDVARKLKRGDGLAAPLRATGVWPPLALHLIQVGEETGELPEMLSRTAMIFEREVQVATARLLSLLTPVLTLLTGGIVAAVVSAILSAILSVYSVPL